MCLTDGESIEIALEDLTVRSLDRSKVRTFLMDLQMRSLHSGPLTEIIVHYPLPLTLPKGGSSVS